nr:hypothetical protein [Klebsiella pneumoniae subsp. pneumoniae]
MSVMASPNGNLDEVHEGLLLQAVQAAWLSKRNQARVDDVVQFLQDAKDSDEYADSPTIRGRLDEMIILLDQYTVNGIYGDYFNSDKPTLHDDARMVVLELGGLESRPSAYRCDVFIDYLHREQDVSVTAWPEKLNVIDEGWKLLDFKNEKVGQFIEKATVPRVDIPAHTSPSRRTSSTSTPRPPPAPHVQRGELIVQGHSEAVSEGICQV